MQHKKVFSLLIFGMASMLNADTAVSPYYSIRSQSRDKTRQMVGTVGLTHLYDMESFWGMGSIMVEYTRSFRPNQIAHTLFGADLINVNSTTTLINGCQPCNTGCNSRCNSIRIQGSQVANRDPRAWLADYFYLPTDFSSTISFSPRISNVIVDLDMYLGLDEWLCGLYFRAYGPITHTRWDLNFCEAPEVAGTNSFTQGYFNPSGISRANLLPNFTSYAQGQTITSIDGITFDPLNFARIDNCNKTKTGFAELRLELGWDFWQSPCYYLGFNVQTAAPTGTRVKATRVFNPVVGNGKHWELGAGVVGGYVFWNSDAEDQSFGFYFDANITHLFKARQQRTFDLCGKPNSRYMLAEKLGTPIVDNLTVNAVSDAANPGPAPLVSPIAQFQNEYAPVANLTTLDVKVSVGVQADIVAMFNYSSCGFSWDLGYDFWAVSCEKISCPQACDNKCETNSLCSATQRDVWALKGDARTFGFIADVVLETPIPLSATESAATIHSGTNNGSNVNANVDNPLFAYGEITDVRLLYSPGVADTEANHIKTSSPPVFINCSDINFQRLHGMSHKIFTHFSYTWDRECWIPFFGVGGFAEFGQGHGSCQNSCITVNPCTTGCSTTSSTTANCCNNKSKSCLNSALSQWGVWVKGGVAFN